MCGRFVSVSSPASLSTYFEANDDQSGLIEAEGERWRANANVAPGRQILAVVEQPDEGRRLVRRRWGLIPPWAKDQSVGYRMINARCETAQSKPSFRKAAAGRRALVPADGFYEWYRPSAGAKQPYLIHRPDGEPYAFGALWERWSPADGDREVRSVAILTTQANDQMAHIHDRMPVLIARADWAEWLGHDRLPEERFSELCAPAHDDLITYRPVSTEVNDARHKGVHLLEAVPAPPGAPFATDGSVPVRPR